MREIKFRGKRIDNNKWAYGFGYKDGVLLTYFGYDDYVMPYASGIDVNSKTVGDYTGLKDKNNKEIYEGDIILVPSLYKDEILEDGTGPEDDYFQICEVVEQDGCFGIITKKDELFNKGFYSFREIKKDIGVNMYEIEVIGNIFDNPELKGGK